MTAESAASAALLPVATMIAVASAMHMERPERKSERIVTVHQPGARGGIPEQGITAGCEHLIVPPFVEIVIPAGRRHQAEQQHPVALCSRRRCGAAVECAWRQIVEAGAHVERRAGLPIRKAQIDRDAPRVRRAPPRVREEGRVRALPPERPLRFDRAIAVEDDEFQALRAGEIDGAVEQRCGVGVEVAGCPAVDAAARDVVVAGVRKRQRHVEARRSDLDQAGHGCRRVATGSIRHNSTGLSGDAWLRPQPRGC